MLGGLGSGGYGCWGDEGVVSGTCQAGLVGLDPLVEGRLIFREYMAHIVVMVHLNESNGCETSKSETTALLCM